MITSGPSIEPNDRDIRVACGVAWWKRKRIAQFLVGEGQAPLRFIDDALQAVAAAGDGAIAVWPSRLRLSARSSNGVESIPRCSKSFGLPTATMRPSTFPTTPLPGIA